MLSLGCWPPDRHLPPDVGASMGHLFTSKVLAVECMHRLRLSSPCLGFSIPKVITEKSIDEGYFA